MRIIIAKWVEVDAHPFKGPFNAKVMKVIYSTHENIHHGDRFTNEMIDIVGRQGYQVVLLP